METELGDEVAHWRGATYGETGLGQRVNDAGHGGRRSKVIESSGGKALWGRSTRENTTKLGGGGLGCQRWKRSGRWKVDPRVDLRRGKKGGEVACIKEMKKSWGSAKVDGKKKKGDGL